MSSTNRNGAKRLDHDFYSTPLEAFDPIIPYLPRTAKFWEPACGDRRLIVRLKEFGRDADGSDLSDGADFLQDDRLREFIITNPPFSLAQEFVTHSLEVADETMLLLRLNFLGSQKRKDWWKAHEPDAIFVLSSRPDFTGGGGDSCEYGWFAWSHRYKGIHHI